MSDIAIVRKELLASVPSVRRTWFEWEIEKDVHTKTLVVEVAFNTDPNGIGFEPGSLDDIRNVCLETLRDKTTMVISRVKVVPERP